MYDRKKGKGIMKGLARKQLALVLAFLLVALSIMPQTSIAAAKTKINKKKVIVLVSQSVKLSVKGKKKGVKWSSSNKKVAKVSRKGKVTGRKPGKAIIKAKIGRKVLKCKVLVKVGLDHTKMAMKAGESKKIKLLGAKIKKASSTNRSVALVTKKGVVKAVGAGSATIRITGSNKKKYTCKVTVQEKANDSSGELKPAEPGQKDDEKKDEDTSNNGDEKKEDTSGDDVINPDDQDGDETPDDGSYDDEEVIDNLEDGIVDKGDLQVMYEKEVIDIAYGKDGSVQEIDGKFSDEKILDSDDAVSFIGDKTDFLNGFEAWNSEVTENEDDGEKFFRMSPEYDGIPVLGSQVILSADDDGDITGLTSSYNSAIRNVDTYEEIDGSDAEEAALKAVMESEDVDTLIKDSSVYQNNEASYEELYDALKEALQTDSKLMIYAADRSNTPRLVYKVDVTGPYFNEDESESSEESTDTSEIMPTLSVTVYINANYDVDEPGTVFYMIDNREGWTDTTVSSSDISNVSGYTLNVQMQDGKYRLVDSTRNISIYKTKHTGALWWKSVEVPGDIATTGGLFNKADNEAVYCMSNLKTVYNYYNNVLGRKSYDDKGKEIVMSYDYYNYNLEESRWLFGWYYHNAHWDPNIQQFCIGNDGGFYRATDVIGHEFTHAVINYVVGNGYDVTLTYSGESGSLNESYADIMGTLIENKSDDGRWLLGEDADKASRSLADPSKYGDPKHYKDYDSSGSESHIVHTNSSIFNHAAYKMMTDSRTSNVSGGDWANVFYHSLFKLTSDSQFIDARRAVLYAANRDGFTAEEQNAIKDAFDAVGITEPDSIRIVLTWGETPADLDSHLVGPKLYSEDRFHIYFEDKTYFDDEWHAYIADLDYDDVTSYGPEVTTIHDIDYEGDYYFYVHDYTTGEDAESQAMGNSGAKVKIYRGRSRKPAVEYSITPGAKGTIWNVCKIHLEDQKATATPINTYGATASYS